MCGILGFIGKRDFSPEAFGVALDTMAKRGPDDRGIYEGPEVLLGHRRLAILDLSETGHQPMISHDGRYVMVYNGEIYNYKELRKELEERGTAFHSTSDSEVVLEFYAQEGPSCLGRFIGMFAIAIWDTKERSLFLARDRMGIKPLYVCARGHSIAFASQVKALQALPATSFSINPVAIAQYLLWGHIPGPITITEGIENFPPATWAFLEEWRTGAPYILELPLWRHPLSAA